MEIVSFQKELYDISKTDIGKEDLFDVTSDINYIVVSMALQNLAIYNMLVNIKSDPLYETKNKIIISEFLNNLKDYYQKNEVGTQKSGDK